MSTSTTPTGTSRRPRWKTSPAGPDALVKQRLVRELGASNYARRIGEVHTIAQSNGMTTFTILQNEYNLVERGSYPPELQRLCIERGIAMLPWFGLAAGFLTGKYRNREDLERFNRGSSIRRFFDKGRAARAMEA